MGEAVVTRCNRPDCGRGAIDAEGFCEVCDREPLPPERAAPGTVPGTAPARARQAAGVGVAQVRPDPWYGLDLAGDGPVPEEALRPPAQTAGPVAEEHRFCPNPACGRPVGRGHDGRPGRTVGFCPHCGTRFDFGQIHGLVIAGRYQVERVLGSGAYGAAYLALDRNLETHVVVKALNRSVADTADRERAALVGLRHDSIVRILGYESEGPHLVLEYVPGTPLSARDGDRLENLLGHGVRILQALDYLHARGLLHCDVKPLNIIRFAEEGPDGPLDRVRLIDFGAVRSRRVTGPVVAYTKAYAPPEHDPEHQRPTPGFDLYGLGMTLRELCRDHLKDRTAPGVDSLALLLERATDDRVPRRRFVSARQFGEQLSGVIRQVVAEHRQVTRPSALFGSLTEPLHGGLGTARPPADWVRASWSEKALLTMPAPFSSPRPHEVAAALPAPLADPDDPRVTEAAGSALAESRLAVRRRDVPRAQAALAAAHLPSWHWLHAWYEGLIALAREDPGEATGHFARVRADLPGELIPQLALGLCAELRGDGVVARSHYDAVFGTTPALGAAGFGLARVHLLAGRRDRAVATAERLTQEFRFEREARVAAVRLLVTVPDRPGPAAPTGDDLAQARAALAGLPVDDAAAAALRAEIQYADFLLTGDRLQLSEAVRALGPHAATEREYVALVDLANRLRPAPEWRWPRPGSRTRPSRFRRPSETLSS
ncbi:tetratricopeptide repeat protein [Streptomyces echinoruber]|uniref:non-specific serine/threonine protein kinase n=1 Tax=Streptomyces echinoruber TaxID=68898 RepID=A0A918VFC3_9ACTN|nr:tetratricopeptide repeat protein [Streptomyces echinoruber]GGZ94676.1 serine/threonine protein kinase [Streptomyces echinoruber]